MLLVLVLVVLFFAIVGFGTYICYKKKQNRKNGEKETDDVKMAGEESPLNKYMRKKRSSDNFMIPLITVPQQLPFSVQEDPIQMTNEMKTTYPSEQYYPPASNPILTKHTRKKRKDRKQELKRSQSCPTAVGGVIQEEDEDEESENSSETSSSSNSTCTTNVLQQDTVYGSEGKLHPYNNRDRRKRNFKKSTRDLLEAPRRISVYDDTTMDVTQLTLARRRGSSLTQEESFKKAGMIHFSTEYLQQEKIFQVKGFWSSLKWKEG